LTTSAYFSIGGGGRTEEVGNLFRQGYRAYLKIPEYFFHVWIGVQPARFLHGPFDTGRKLDAAKGHLKFVTRASWINFNGSKVRTGARVTDINDVAVSWHWDPPGLGLSR
jgi:hypothetical protein